MHALSRDSTVTILTRPSPIPALLHSSGTRPPERKEDRPETFGCTGRGEEQKYKQQRNMRKALSGKLQFACSERASAF